MQESRLTGWRCVATLFVAAAALPCQSQWRQAHPVTPFGTAWGAAAAADDAHQRVVSFGGSSAGTVTNATRLWDGVTWQTASLSTPSPAARRNASMAYDAVRQRIVMFGGFTASGSPLADLWEWDGAAWLQIAATGPWARGNAAMGFDGTRVVLFGGQAIPGAWFPFADTWAFDGVSWQSLAPAASPISREGAQVASGNGEILLFGGANAGTLFADTWRWNGTTWSQVATALTPPARAFGSLAFDSSQNRYVLVCGAASALFADTFVFANGQWSAGPVVGALHPRSGASAAFHAQTGRVVLAGGFAGSFTATDTWEFGDDLASVTAFGAGCSPASSGGPSLVVANGQPTVSGSVTVRFGIQQGWPLLAIGFSDVVGPLGPLPFALAALGAGPACQLWTNADILVVMPGMPQPTATIAIPNDPAIEDLAFFVQGLSLPLPSLEFAGLHASQGLRCVVDRF
jgi:hypothetical protein